MNRFFLRLASLRLTLFGFVGLAVALVVDQTWPGHYGWGIAASLVLLGVNLAFALVFDPRFRRKPLLFSFHACLLLLAVAAAYGQLVRYDARVALVEGQALDPQTMKVQRQGPLARPRLAEGAIRQGAVEVDYTAGLNRGATRSRVWSRESGWLVVGDDIPLLLDGYRVYTTSNKGFAVLVLWDVAGKPAQLGAIHFPSYPASEIMQRTQWRTPVGQELALALTLPPSGYGEDWTLTTDHGADASLRLAFGETAVTLSPGEAIALDGGTLRFTDVRMWMGYRVTYDPTLAWLLSLALMAVAFMALHLAQRIRQPVQSMNGVSAGCAT